MLNVEQLENLIIEPTLSKLNMYSKFAKELLLFTCATETLGGTYIKQVNGVALGIYQIEPATHTDIWENYIKYRPIIVQQLGLHFNCVRQPEPSRLMYDLQYSTIMARLQYFRHSEQFPELDTDGLWYYYKKYFNTHLGKATKERSVEHYLNYVKNPAPTPCSTDVEPQPLKPKQKGRKRKTS